MRTPLFQGLASGCALLACTFAVAIPQARAQGLAETMAGVEGQNTLNSGPVGGGGAAQLALDRARGVAGGNPAAGAPPAAPAGLPPAAPAAAPAPSSVPFSPAPGVGAGAPPPATGVPATGPIPPRITVIAGTRIFDAVTGSLLDDAQEQLVPESQKSAYFDDGTHGDVQANDGKYTRIDESRDYLAQSNQRVKEELVQALVAANGMNPLQFYGYSLMSSQRTEGKSRSRAWKLVPAPNGIGSVLKEMPIDKPLEVPVYREQLAEKDKKVKDDWSDRFLQEFRKNKDSLLSEFYPMYIPQPPAQPNVPPPAGWRPFGAVAPGVAPALAPGQLPPGF